MKTISWNNDRGSGAGRVTELEGGRAVLRTATFSVLLLFIASVSVHDAMLVLLNHEVILEFEQNPLGHWLMSLAQGDVRPFVAVKLACTAIVCAALVELYERAFCRGLGIASAVALFQGILLVYLSVA